MRFSAILIALTASVFAEKNLVKCLERANYDVGLSYDCFEKAIEKGRKSKDHFLLKNVFIERMESKKISEKNHQRIMNCLLPLFLATDASNFDTASSFF